YVPAHTLSINLSLHDALPVFARIAELEKTTDHDVVAFVSQVAESVGEEGRYLHFGLTSSDVLDTALALQCQAASELMIEELEARSEEHTSELQSHLKLVCRLL